MKVTHLLSLLAIVFVVALLFLQSGNHQRAIEEWQEAARPVVTSRGLSGANVTPKLLEQALCDKCAMTHKEVPNFLRYGNHAYHANE